MTARGLVITLGLLLCAGAIAVDFTIDSGTTSAILLGAGATLCAIGIEVMDPAQRRSRRR